MMLSYVCDATIHYRYAGAASPELLAQAAPVRAWLNPVTMCWHPWAPTEHRNHEATVYCCQFIATTAPGQVVVRCLGREYLVTLEEARELMGGEAWPSWIARLLKHREVESWAWEP